MITKETFRATSIKLNDLEVGPGEVELNVQYNDMPASRIRELVRLDTNGIKFADDLTLDEAKLIIEQLIVNAKKVLYPAEVDNET